MSNVLTRESSGSDSFRFFGRFRFAYVVAASDSVVLYVLKSDVPENRSICSGCRRRRFEFVIHACLQCYTVCRLQLLAMCAVCSLLHGTYHISHSRRAQAPRVPRYGVAMLVRIVLGL